jgi:hypothetical protein
MSGFHFGKLPFDCPAVDLEINSVNEGSFAAGSTINLTLTDGTNPVTPESVTVVGNDVEVEVSAGAAPSGRELMKTGQTTSFRTGDDGDLQEGRDVDFFTLDYNNPFGNTNRFTDELGGQDYTDDIVIDWSTYNAVTGEVLGWSRVSVGVFNWNLGIENALSFSVGAFTTGWRMPNNIEINSISNFELTQVHNYAPFNINFEFWSSTTFAPSTSQAWRIQINGTLAFSGKTNLRNVYPVRTFTVTGTTLT